MRCQSPTHAFPISRCRPGKHSLALASLTATRLFAGVTFSASPHIVNVRGGNLWCAREAGDNAGESPAGAIRRFSTEDRPNCVTVR
jgi:hypothetical protein